MIFREQEVFSTEQGGVTNDAQDAVLTVFIPCIDFYDDAGRALAGRR